MKKAKLLLLTLLSVLGMTTAGAETVSPYTADFNTAISTSVHDFQVASNWKHIVPNSNYDGYGPYWMSYSYSSTEGVGGSGTLIAYRQYAGDYQGGEVVSDILVTPVVSGEVKLYVKASGLASTSNPSFVELYNVNDAGTETTGLIQRFTADDYVACEVADDTDPLYGWSTVTINVASAQRIGIRGQYVYMDDFTAASAELVKEAKLTITGLTSVDGGTYYPNQKADGSVDIALKVTVKNQGEVDLKAGDTNYTLSLVKKAYYGSTVTEYDDVTFAIPVDIAIGEEATFEASFSAPSTLGTSWMYLKVKENISGTISSAQVQTQVKEYASKFIFDKAGSSYYSSSSATRTPISFGKITESATLEYEIYNQGSAPLVINSFTLPAGYTSDAPAGEFTVNGEEKKVIVITLPATTPGIFAGDLTIEYTNFGQELATYTLGVSGTVIDPSKNLITFSNADNTNGQFPAGSIHAEQVYISSQTSGDVTNYYLQSVNSPVTKFVTPLLTAAAGESFTYDTWYSSYSYSAAVTVYTSKDRITWTQVDKQTYSSGIGSTANTFTVTIEEAGDYYLAFELEGNALLDNIYGLTLAATPAHDWYVLDSDVPTTATQNKDYTATISVKNISSNADEITTATLYVDGEAVAVEKNVALEGNAMTAVECTGRISSPSYSNIADPVEIALTYKPHTFGSFEGYIELKNGDKVVKTEPVTIEIAEEKTESDAALAASSTNSRYGIVSPYYNHSGSESLLTPSVLETMGVTNGAKIKKIYVKGYNTSGETTHATKVWVGNSEETELSTLPFTPYDTEANSENLTLALDEDYVYQQAGTYSETVPMIEIDLSENPLVYTGGSIRIIAKADIVTTYKQVSFEKSNVTSLCQAYAYDSGSLTYNATELPAFHFELAVEEKTLSGTVKDAEGNAIEDAKVVIRNDENDVEYFAVTDADGAYTMNVVQNKLTYTATVTADGYEPLEDETVLSFAEESVEKDFVLTSIENAIDVTITDSQYATLYYENLHLLVPEGITANTAKADGKKITLTNVGEVIPAGTPVVLNGPEGKYKFEIVQPIDQSTLVSDNEAKAWKANGNTAVAAGSTYVDDDLLKVETVFAGTLKKEAQTIDGEYFTHYIQVRVDKSPTEDFVTGTEKNGSTPLVIKAKKNAKLTVFMRRQKGSNGYEVNDNKDIRLYNQADLSLLDGELSIESYQASDTDEQAYGFGTKTFELEADNTYTLCVSGSTLKFYGFTYEEMAAPEVTDNDLVGSEDGAEVSEAGYKYYILSWADAKKDPKYLGFYYQYENGTKVKVNPHQAYLRLPATGASAGGYQLVFAADGINSVTANVLSDTDAIYTLSGVRVNTKNLQKGIYIVNGKKVVIK